MKNRNVLIGCAIVAFVVFMMFVFVGILLFVGRSRGGDSMKNAILAGGGGDRVGLIYVTGVITTGRSTPAGFMGEASCGSDTIVKLLRDASERSNVPAIVLRIDSPGGSAAASQEIFNEIMRIKKETDKYVVVSMGSVAASGGYYVAAASDHIVANPATLTGSIGVIMSYLNFQDLFEKLGMKPVVLKSGEHKDIASPYRELTPEEREMLEGALRNIHEQFIDDVARGRKMEPESVRKVADGRIFTGEQALDAGLVDSVGGLQQALNKAAEEKGLDVPPKVEHFQKDNPFSFLFDAMGNVRTGASPERALGMLSDTLLLNPILANQ